MRWGGRLQATGAMLIFEAELEIEYDFSDDLRGPDPRDHRLDICLGLIVFVAVACALSYVVWRML